MMKISDLPKPVRHKAMPDCVHEPTNHLRIFIEVDERGRRVNVLEQMFLDGYGKPFWAPLPKVVQGND